MLAELNQSQESSVRYVPGYGVAAGWSQRDEGYHFYHLDEQNSTVYITGTEGGIENSYRYDAFGVVRDCQEGTFNRILYTGQQYDQASGQYYLRARYYNPVVGRFTQEDVYRGDGLNLYAYCKNNPVIYYDPSGYTAWDDFRAAVKGLGMSLQEMSREYHEQYGYNSSKIIYRDKNGNIYTYGDPRYRPSYGAGQVMEVWNNAKTGGIVKDSGTIIEWDEHSSRVGVWDMGHNPGCEYIRAYDRYMRQEYDPNDFARNEALFLEEYRTASNYHPQTPHNNRTDNQTHSTLTEEDFKRLGIERVDNSDGEQQTESGSCDSKNGNG